MDIEDSVKKTKRAGYVLVASIALLMAGILYAFSEIGEVRERVTVVERSPCRVSLESKECQQVVHRIFQALPTTEHCFNIKRVLTPEAYLRLTRCPTPQNNGRADSQNNGRDSPQNNGRANAEPGGDALQPSPGGQQPSPAPPGSHPDLPVPIPDPPDTCDLLPVVCEKPELPGI